MMDTVFEELVRNKTFIETCNFLRSHAVCHDQQNKEKATRQVNTTSQPSTSNKKYKTKQVLALINELQIQDSTVLEDEVQVPLASKTAMVCKLAQVPPEIWNFLSLEAKKWLLNERKRQQQEDDKLKKSSNSVSRDTPKSSSIEPGNPSSNSNMPNQYARVKNAVKGEDDNQDQPPTYGFIDEFLEDAIKSSNLYEEQDADYEPGNSEHTIYTSISMNSTLHNKCMSLFFLPEKHHINILGGGGADTCV
jgi:hypothetical protein